MSEEIQTEEVPAFGEYAVSIGTVINHEAGYYIVRLFDGRVVGIPAQGETTTEGFEAAAVAFTAANGL